MVKFDLRKYVEQIRAKLPVVMSEEFIEKDYVLSNFLSCWSKMTTPALDKLIFKGGTLLTKHYLKYHRISEDLDFTHQEAKDIGQLENTTSRETRIKHLVIPIIEELKLLADGSSLDFDTDRTNARYIEQRNSRSIYFFRLYYISVFTGVESYIKLEISFVEHIIETPRVLEIQNIVDYLNVEDVDLRILNYELQHPFLTCYPVNEIILEKIRATLTREQFKFRDAYDLYLLQELNNVDIFASDKKDIFTKLNSYPFESDNVARNIRHFLNATHTFSKEDIESLALKEVDFSKLELFYDKLIIYLKDLGEEFLVG